jgi:non-canonical poly(A) RNA polymerase PAPD5/7
MADTTLPAYGVSLNCDTSLLTISDIDLVVSTRDYNQYQKVRLLSELARAMRMAHITDEVVIISRAKVPSVKFETSHGESTLDLASFKYLIS